MGFDPGDLSGLGSLSDPSATALWLAVGGVGALLGLWFYVGRALRWKPWWVLAPALAIAGATLLRIAVTSGIDSDESEHLHIAYVIGHGALPYRDFDQNHGPFLWLLTAPLLRILPETPYVLYLFRALALASFLGSVAVACSLAKQLTRGSGLVAPLVLFLALATAVNAEVYRFRPDPFMNLCALLSLYFLLRPAGSNAATPVVASKSVAGNRARQVLFAGLLQGLAIAFSPKLAHLALLAPAVLWLEWRRDDQREGLRGLLRSILPYALGGFLALVPLLLWLGWNGLLQEAYFGIVGRNLASASRRLAESASDNPAVYSTDAIRLLQLSPLFLLSLIGAASLLLRREGRRAPTSSATGATPAWLLAAWMAAACLLWSGVWLLAPNTGTYHIAGLFVLGAPFGAHALDRLLSTQQRVAMLATGLLLSLCLASAPLRSGVGGWTNGYTYPLARVAWLLDAVRSRGGGCLCLVPWHPIFIPTVSPVYVSNERNSRRWGEAVEWAAERRPAAVMSRRFYLLAERGKISQEQADRIVQVLKQNYRLRSAGSAGFWLLKSERRD